MSNNFNKLFICWIDDNPDVGYPTPNIPKKYLPYFDINRKTKDGEFALSYTSMADITPDLHEFLIKEYETDHFPCEILALDYDLSKANSVFVSNEESTTGDNPDEIPLEDTEDTVLNSVGSDGNAEIDFDGLLIGIFYATLARKHPMGVVPMSYRMQDLSGTSVPDFQELTRPALGIDFNVIDKDKDDQKRSWKNIIRFGVQHLRARIKVLYLTEDIIVSHTDLMQMIENPDHEILTIKSPYVDERRYPVRGLFADYWDSSVEEMHKAIRDFAIELLEADITIEQYTKALKLSKTLWEFFNKDKLMDKHFKLSKLFVEGKTNTAEYNKLKELFGLTSKPKNNECLNNVFDIRSEPNRENKADKYTKEDRRWAAILLTRQYFKRILIFMQQARVETSIGKSLRVYPSVEEDDILLLLFPMPKNPFPLPWHIEDAKTRSNAKSGWTNWMKKNLNLLPSTLLSGTALSPGECRILRGLAIGDTELGDTPAERLYAWREYEPTRLFLFGSRNR